MNINDLYNLSHCPICNNKLSIPQYNVLDNSTFCKSPPIKHEFYFYKHSNSYIFIRINNSDSYKVCIQIESDKITKFYILQSYKPSILLNHNLFTNSNDLNHLLLKTQKLIAFI